MAQQITPQPFQPGLQLQDGTALNAAINADQVTTQDAVPAPGTSTATGFQITAEVTRFSAISAGSVIILPRAIPGAQATVIFPSGSVSQATFQGFLSTDTINGSATLLIVLAAANKATYFVCIAAGTWLAYAGGSSTPT